MSSEKVGKGLQLLGTSAILSTIAEVWLKDSKNIDFYKGRNKQLLNHYFDFNKQQFVLYNNLEKQVKLSDVTKQIYQSIANDNFVIDDDIIEDDLELAKETIKAFAFIFLQLTDTTKHDFYTILKNLLKGEKVYTQQELDYYLKKNEKTN